MSKFRKCALPECPTEARAKGNFCSDRHASRARNRRYDAKRRGPAKGVPAARPVPAEKTPEELQLSELRGTLLRTQRSLAVAKAKSEDLVEAVYRASRDAMVVLGPVPQPQPVFKLSKADRKHDETALIHTTDWQLGKLTESYDMDTCEARVKLMAFKIGMLTEIQRTAHPVSRCHIMAGGDMVENVDIFPGQAYEIEETLFAQMFRAVRILVNLIEDMLAVFEVVEFTGEPGNHGRFGRRGQFPAGDNADRMVYKIASQHFANNPRVIWHGDSGGWHQIVDVGKYRAMLIHGDEIKSFGGNTPAFGLLRKGTAWASGVVDGGFDDIYFGHFHTPMMLTLPNGKHMYGTGSTESDNAYAAEFVAARGKPSQRLHFIDPRKGRVTAEYQLYLDEEEGSSHGRFSTSSSPADESIEAT